MMPHCRIPSHITALYIFAVVNLMALFHITLVEAYVVVIDKARANVSIETYEDIPANFGPPIPIEGLAGHLANASPSDGCKAMEQPPSVTNSSDKVWIALIERGNCNFDRKVLHAQKAGFKAAIVYNSQGDSLLPMGGNDVAMEVEIPSVFIGELDGDTLRIYNDKLEYYIVIDQRIPPNANLYLLPFAVVVGICFICMLVFMVAKWIKDLRKRRRCRLSKTNLNKIPVKKFKKCEGENYDVCAICLDDYEDGEKLRILPCSHAYHMKCIDPWLTKNKKTCPVCKRKVMPGDETSSSESESEDEADTTNENTPLIGPPQGGAASSGTGRLASFGTTVLNALSRRSTSREPSTPLEASSRSSSESSASPAQSFNHSINAEIHGSSPRNYGSTDGHHDNHQQDELEGAVGGSSNPLAESVVDIVEDHYAMDVDTELPPEQELTNLFGESSAADTDREVLVSVVGPRRKGKKKKKRRNNEDA